MAGQARAVQVKMSITYEVSRENEPIAEVGAGQEFSLETLDAYSGRTVTREAVREPGFFSQVVPLTGPVAVEGVQAGQWLAVSIRSLETAPVGALIMRSEVGLLGKYWSGPPEPYVFTVSGSFASNPELGSFPIRPMIGTICVAPESGQWWSGLNGPHVGNVDCPELGQGATIVLPVQVPGGQIYAGDGHAIMGHGELGGTGIEIGLRMTLSARPVTGPRHRSRNRYAVIHAADGWFGVIGRGKTVDSAINVALRNVRAWLSFLGCDHQDARISLQGEARVCQIVNNAYSATVGLYPHPSLRSRIEEWTQTRPARQL